MNSTTLIIVAVAGVALVAYMASQKSAATQTAAQPGGQAFTFGLSVPIK